MAPRSALSQVFINGFPKGSNPDQNIDRLDPDEAKYIQDIWVDTPPNLVRRGPIKAPSGTPTKPTPGSAIFWCRNPAGTIKVCIITGSTIAGTVANVLDATLTGYDMSLQLFTGHSYSPPYIYDVKPALKGGVWIGISNGYEVGTAVQRLLLWRGGSSTQYNPATVTVSFGGKAVTGLGTTFTSSVTPGMFLYTAAGARFVGVVASIQSNTALTLEDEALQGLAGVGARFDSFRGFERKIASGAISATTASAVITGANTKFVDEAVAANYDLYRALDNRWLGSVLSITDNFTLTLNANCNATMNADEYYILSNAPDYGSSIIDSVTSRKPGFLNAVYADRQWFANRTKLRDAGGGFIDRLWFSNTEDGESVDMSQQGGSYFTLAVDRESGSPIRALLPTTQALLALKNREVFAIYGSTPDDFNSKKIADDGAISAMAATTYGSSAIWAGRKGIYLWDGTDPINLLSENFQRTYSSVVKSLPSNGIRAWGTVKRDYFFLDIYNATPTIDISVGLGTITEAQDHLSLVIHIPTRALVFTSNFAFRGSADIPHDLGDMWWYIANTQDNLITSGNFETGTTDWLALGSATIQLGTSYFYLGSQSLEVFTLGDNDGAEGAGVTSVSAGDTVKTVMRVYSPDAATNVTVNHIERTAGLAFVRESTGATVTLKVGWNTITASDPFVGTAGAVRISPAIRVNQGSPAADFFALDDVRQYNITNPSWTNSIGDFLPMLDGQGLDTLITEQNVPGPFFYLESGGLDAEDATLKKRWRNILFHYLSKVDTLTVELVTNFDTVGTVVTTTFPAVTAWSAKLIRFMKSSQILRFKLYQSSRKHTEVKVGPGSIGYKPQRRGTV